MEVKSHDRQGEARKDCRDLRREDIHGRRVFPVRIVPTSCNNGSEEADKRDLGRRLRMTYEFEHPGIRTCGDCPLWKQIGKTELTALGMCGMDRLLRAKYDKRPEMCPLKEKKGEE